MSNTVTTEDQQTPDDQTLAAACRKGDTAAFECLVLRYQRMLFNVALRMSGNYDDASDIVQDALISAWHKIGEFRGEARLGTWLTAIVVNLTRNRIRQRNVSEQRSAFSLDAPGPGSDGKTFPELPDKSASALQQLEDSELKEKVQNCIGKLELQFREVLVLRDMQELSYEEVGAALKLAEGTVKSRLFRARDAVKNCLKRALDRT
jgi:RNA polymerase sigma-70 factor (ECF subfamily)